MACSGAAVRLGSGACCTRTHFSFHFAALLTNAQSDKQNMQITIIICPLHKVSACSPRLDSHWRPQMEAGEQVAGAAATAALAPELQPVDTERQAKGAIVAPKVVLKPT